MRTKQVRPEKLKYEYELHIRKGRDNVQDKDYILFTFIFARQKTYLLYNSLQINH